MFYSLNNFEHISFSFFYKRNVNFIYHNYNVNLYKMLDQMYYKNYIDLLNVAILL